MRLRCDWCLLFTHKAAFVLLVLVFGFGFGFGFSFASGFGWEEALGWLEKYVKLLEVVIDDIWMEFLLLSEAFILVHTWLNWLWSGWLLFAYWYVMNHCIRCNGCGVLWNTGNIPVLSSSTSSSRLFGYADCAEEEK